MSKFARYAIISLVGILLLGIHTVFGQSLSSSNYRILFESVNCGAQNSSSTNYRVESTGCEPASTDLSSASYIVSPAFQGLEDIPFLTVAFSDPDGNNQPNTITFGELATTATKTDRIAISVTTNAVGGYASTIAADGPFRKSTDASSFIPGASDGPAAISAGDGKYGFKTSNGSFDSNYTDITTNPKAFVSSSAPVNANETTLTFTAAAGSNTGAGDYTQTLYIITTATF
ncbi:hypothetical protein HY622_01300 [Candidatus Uhrbacteria bacterium]|nr:hypothetical protein [Candidatus Uhrbacteria bacterium]